MTEHDLDLALRSEYDSRLADPAPSRLATRVLAIPTATPRQRYWLPSIRIGRTQTMLSATKFVVAGITIAFLGGLYAVGVLPQRSAEDAPGALASPSGEPASPRATADSTTRTSTSEADPRVAGSGPWLDWEPLSASESDALSDAISRGIRHGETDLTFPGGEPVEWDAANLGYKVATRDGEVFTDDSAIPVSYRPLEIVVERPDGNTVTSTIDGSLEVGAVAIGPRGVVLATRITLENPEIVRLATKLENVRNCCRLDNDGVVRVKPGHGLPREIEPADYRGRLRAVGMTPNDVVTHRNGAGRAGAWFSPDGESWTRVEDWPFRRTPRLFATEDGFFAAAGRGLLFSPDGQTWSQVPGGADFSSVIGVRGGSLLLDDRRRHGGPGRLHLADAAGVTMFPLDIDALRESEGADWSLRWSELGLVGYDGDHILYSPDGQQWSVSTVPLAWKVELGPYRGPTLIVQDGETLIVLPEREGESWYRVVSVSEPPA